ncbi:dehydrogenase/reductase SDR family member FEY [Morus notabilis]|uniref:dehydrogenase/reductase SDR family member FEY n=1 Tax=Morus notabilis TaxID=981085 RepID=UPI000CECF607|nr:dehydrogenase/reductase SDR family member FEY [Morus notabilis]
MDLERRAWLRGIWETLKEILLQKILTYHLRSSPLVLPSHLEGLNVIVTGATSGIGLHTARELAMAGAHVVMACRNVNAANEIAQQWRQDAYHGRALNVKVMELDLLSLSSVRQFAVEWDQHLKSLHILINNAGILRMGERQECSKDGVEQHLQVNHVAPALLTLLLLPSMLKATTWRVVNVNSVTHHWGMVELRSWKSRIEEHKYSGLKAYGSSKLVHLMFLKALASNLLDQGCNSVQCVAVHPGVVTTNLVPGVQKKTFWRFEPSEGARSVLYCATSNQVVDKMVKGFAYYSSNCKPAKVSPQAAKMEACLDVWEATLSTLDLDINYLRFKLNPSCIRD